MNDDFTAALIVIGAEILSGRTVDTNSRFLARGLHGLGVELRRIIVIPDEVGEIAAAVRSVGKDHTYVFTSGGIGPTPDDVTVQGIAEGLGRAVVRHPDLERIIRSKYEGDPVNTYRLRMADVPEGTRLIDGPGLFLPVLVVGNIYILPGIPEILERKFEFIKDEIKTVPFLQKSIYVNCYESALVPHLNDVIASFPGIKLGSYPTLKKAAYSVVITLESKDSEHLQLAYASLMQRLPREAVVKTS